MDDDLLEELKQQLLELRDSLRDDNEAGEEARGTVALDQSSVGRLSRMDAMQGQAMAQASERRRDKQLEQIELVLEEMTGDDYGICRECGEPIADARLRIDPTVKYCIDCAASGEERG